MGRYDKIKVYNGSSWVKPSRIRVFANNAWQDLGTDDSSITKTLYVQNGSSLARATLNRTVVTVPGESYTGGDGFQVLPANGYCFCPKSGYDNNATWFFRATIRKVADGDQNVFYVADGSWANFIQITWLSDGRIRVRGKSSYSSYGEMSITSSNSVGKNTWVYLNVTATKNSYNVSITFNGTTTSGKNYNSFRVSGATNWVGSSGVQFKNGFEVQGTAYYGSSGYGTTNYKSIDLSSASGSSSGNYSGIDHIDATTTKVTWT